MFKFLIATDQTRQRLTIVAELPGQLKNSGPWRTILVKTKNLFHDNTLSCQNYVVFDQICVSINYLRQRHHFLKMRGSSNSQKKNISKMGYKQLLISSDRTSCTDDGLLYIQATISNFHSVPWCNWCYKCHSKSLKQYQCSWYHKILIECWILQSSNVSIFHFPMFKCFNVSMFQCSNIPLVHWSIGPLVHWRYVGDNLGIS